MTTASSTSASATAAAPAAVPPAGTYPTGVAGFSRAWDGAAWTGPVLSTPDAPELRAPHPVLTAFIRPSFWIAAAGVVLGIAAWVLATALQATVLLAVAGALACGGPLLALVLSSWRKLRIRELPAGRVATVWGLVAGVVSICVAVPIEWLAAGLPAEAGLALAGPIEEGAKLLLPVILLLAMPRVFADPRIGVWTVIVAGAVFGFFEGIEYIGQIQFKPWHVEFLPFTDSNRTVFGASFPLLFERPWVELGHIIWTTGAAVLIWLTAHHRKRALTWLGLVGYLVAAAFHALNDAVFGALGVLGLVLSLAMMIVLYLLWFRDSVRRLVPPDALTLVGRHWRPRISRKARAAAS